MSGCRASYRHLSLQLLQRNGPSWGSRCRLSTIRLLHTETCHLVYPLSTLKAMSRSDLRKINRHNVLLDMEKLNKAKQFHRVFEIAEIFCKQGFDLSWMALNEVIKAMWFCTAEPKHGEVALIIFERLLNQKFNIPKEILKTISSFIINTRDPLLRFKFILLCRQAEFGENSLSLIFSKSVILYTNTNELEQALTLIAEASALDFKLSATCHEVVIHKLLEDNDLDISLQLMKGMLSNVETPIFARLWGHFIAKAAEVQHYQALVWCFHNGIKPGLIYPSDSVYYSMAETGYLNSDKEMTLHAVKQLCERGFDADSHLAALAVETYAREGDITGAFKMLTFLGEAASQVCLRDLPVTVSQLAKSDEYITVASDELVRASKNMRCHPNAQTLLMNITCISFIVSGRIELATQMYEELRSKEFQPNEDTFIMLMEKYSIEGSSLGMEDLYENFVPHIIKPSHLINELLLISLLKVNEAEKALQWLNRFQFTSVKPRRHIVERVNSALDRNS